MTEHQKRRLNASVIEFVNRESERRVGPVAEEEITAAYFAACHDRLTESGATPEQVKRMVAYTLEIGYPQDPFLVCEFDVSHYRIERTGHRDYRREDLDEDDPLLALHPSEIDRILAGLELALQERRAVFERMAQMESLLEPFTRGVTPEPRAAEAMQMLAIRYDKAIADNLEREQWMVQLESLVATARLVQPELDTLAALRAIMPRRIRHSFRINK